ncbi:MAG: DUF3098 domain-containing protein [Tannerellaceae bacterium]|nr:DUF3098 domain-containing protein [Tannerellaceae bacterium]MCD8264876.1 DUF3098 domain-containing protein [Tannerellaceae bacterium]
MAKRDFVFGKDNFIWISISILLIIIGFALMSGGGSTDGVSFNPEIFNTQRIVIAPVITLIGFLLMVFGILKNSNKQEDNE